MQSILEAFAEHCELILIGIVIGAYRVIKDGRMLDKAVKKQNKKVEQLQKEQQINDTL